MKPHHQVLYDELCTSFDVQGKDLLEVGCGWDFRVAAALLGRGASGVICTDMTDRRTDAPCPEGVEFRVMPGEELSLGDESVDLVYGFAVLEHIHDLKGFARELARVLRPAGCAFLHGGPVWSSSAGHHLWVTVEGSDYRFSENSNPIPPWGHLRYGVEGLAAHLEEVGLPESHVAAIVSGVYVNPHINRKTPTEIVDELAEGGLRLVVRRRQPGYNVEAYEALCVDFAPHEDYVTTGIVVEAYKDE